MKLKILIMMKIVISSILMHSLVKIIVKEITTMRKNEINKALYLYKLFL